MFGWLKRAKKPSHAITSFDAIVDLGPSAWFGMTIEDAMAASARAIKDLGGARLVRVREGAGPAAIIVRVFPPGLAVERDGEPWSDLRVKVQGAAMGALVQRAPPHAGTAPVKALRTWRLPDPARTPGPQGFAEAPSQANALAALALLAQSVRSSPSPSPAPARGQTSGEADVAMLARLLGFVLPDREGPTAVAAIRQFGSYAAVLAAPERELRAVAGLGQHSIAAIKLVHEAAIRLARAGVIGQPVLDDPARLYAYLAAAQARAPIEQFRVLFLDQNGKLKADEVQSSGTVNHTPVYPREVVRRALELGAAAIVLVHNHPSGDPSPSGEDIAMTHQISQAALALGLVVRDHIIVGNGRSLSFAEAGLL